MFNMNSVLDYIKARLGASHRKIEFSDEGLIRCITEQTLPEFSIYFPYFCQYRLDTSDDNKVYGSDTTFFVPETINDFQVMGVQWAINSTLVGSNNLMTTEANQITMLGTCPMAALSALVGARLAQTLSTSTGFTNESFTFLPPNMIRLNANVGSYPTLVLRTTHRRDLTTIPFGASSLFKELALCDVCLDIIGIRNYFQNIQTLFAQIQLNVDELKNIAEKRVDLIERFRKEQLKSANIRKVYIL